MFPLNNMIPEREPSSPLHRSPVSQRGVAEDFLEDTGKVIGVVVAEFGRDFLHAQGRGVQIMACSLHPEADVVIDRRGSCLIAEDRGEAGRRESGAPREFLKSQ